jgi:hypothetical protein
MDSQEHSTIREGLIAGLLGAAMVAAWYFVFDAAAGRPFHTPNALGKMVFRGEVGPGEREVIPGIVAGYTVLHLAMFAVGGVAMNLLVPLATRNLSLRMGIWIGLVVGFCLFAGLMYMLFTASGERIPLWSVVGGSLSAVAAMGWYLWRRHPGLATNAQLGDESAPHPPGAQRG